MNQDEIFLKGEGDAWFSRNRVVLALKKKKDLPLELVGRHLKNENVHSIAEIGCSNGWRLAALSAHFPNARLSGADASAEAVKEGKKEWPKLDLQQALISDLPFKEVFDLVIVNFVLHWVSRDSLVRAVAEIDRLVKDEGHLILGDFLPDSFEKRKYHYRPAEEVYTYKQDYPALFKALGTYEEKERIIFNHDDPSAAAESCTSQNRAVTSLLKKSATIQYRESS